MKLRLRNVETKRTLKVEVPEQCTLQELKLIVCDLASLSSSSSLHLSLNRKDDLSPAGSDPETITLNSLGLTSSDLIFFTSIVDVTVSQESLNVVEPNSDILVSDKILENPPELTNHQMSSSELGNDQNIESDTQMEETLIYRNKTENQLYADQTLEFRSEEGENHTGIGETTGMEIDDVDYDTGTGKGFSVPSFLRKVFNKELGDRGGCDPNLVVIAVHALLKESGFVAFDMVLEKKIDGFFYLPYMWPSSGCTLSLCYTLPEIVHSSGVVETVVVKVQRLGKFVNFYGSLAGKGSGTYRVCLDEQRLATVLNLMWANLDTAVGNNGSVIHPEKEVYEFWKTVKDKLTLPLLIDLCEMANLPPPSCFVRLPTDLKLGILELLPGPDMAKAACVSLELHFLSSYDDLWEKKYIEEFGNVDIANVGAFSVENSWKRRFVKAWEAKRRRVSMVSRDRVWVPSNFRDPGMFRSPRIIGGDYDMAPHFLWGGGSSRRRRGSDFMHCTFGNRRA